MSTSVEDSEAVKIAIEICNDSELKRKILFGPDDVQISSNKYYVKQKWDEIVERQAMATLRSRDLPEDLQQKIMGLVPAIGMRMLQWAVYHGGTLLLSRQYSFKFLNSSFFTEQGIIDNKKAAEELMKDENLSTVRKYKIACLYSFTDHIPALFQQVIENVKGDICGFRRLGRPELLWFYSFYLLGQVDEIKGLKTLERYWLEKAIESGSKVAVEYCFEKNNLRHNRNAIVDAAIEAVRNRIKARDDWIVFRDSKYDGRQETWVPNDYYVDIVCFLLSKMTRDQQIEFLKRDIDGVKYDRRFYEEEHNRSRVLEYFLNWPYQDYFMKTAELMWEFLPEKNYADLLLKICAKIEPEKERNLNFVGEKNYDYRRLFKKFWSDSPDRYKRYVLHNRLCRVLIKILSLKRFTLEDEQIIGMILESADDSEKGTILSSEEWRSSLIGLIEGDKLEVLDRCVLSHFSSTEVNVFKRELIVSEYFHHVAFHFVKKDKWDAVESALKWSSLSEEEVNTFKKELIYFQDAKRTCLRLISCKRDVEVANKFIKWCIASEEEIRDYKEKLIFSSIGMKGCQSLVLGDKLELIEKMTSCWLSSQEKIKEFKEKFRLLMGHNICKSLISRYSERHSGGRVTIMFEGGKWERVAKLLTWSFSSEEEIVDFKECLLRDSGKAILLNLITSSQWAEAETFFDWLGLSIDEIKKLKKDTLLDRRFISFFHRLMSRRDDAAYFVHYGSKNEAFEVILGWCLTDEESVLEIQDRFKSLSGGLYYCGQDIDGLSNFDLILEQHLDNIHKEETGLKRKSETVFSSNKRL